MATTVSCSKFLSIDVNIKTFDKRDEFSYLMFNQTEFKS